MATYENIYEPVMEELLFLTILIVLARLIQLAQNIPTTVLASLSHSSPGNQLLAAYCSAPTWHVTQVQNYDSWKAHHCYHDSIN